MMLQPWWCLVILAAEFICLCMSTQFPPQKRKCVFHMNNESPNRHRNIPFVTAGDLNGSVQVCEDTHCCVGYFRLRNGQPVVDLLACDVAEKSCPDSTCRTQTLFHWNYTKCVCNTDLCNGNVTWMPDPEQPEHTASYFEIIKAVGIPFGVLLLACSVVAAIFFRDKEKKLQASKCSVCPLCSCQTPKSSEIDVAGLELQQIIGRGSFATIWQGKYQDSTVAVKVLPTDWKHRFTAEKEVYELPLMKHAGILDFLGTGRKPDDTSCLIVLQFAECGSLCSFLCENTINWMQSLKLCQSLSEGLSYLHSDLHRLDMHKPPVAHRDLSSSNVLVKADGTCALCDFGCSAILRSCSGRQNNPPNMMGYCQFGTLCYMAPEILEGAVNLHSKCWLKQGDIYALGLLLWEIWMQCSDLFQGYTVPQHSLPYASELGDKPTLESLITYVVHSDKRPSIPTHWGLLPQGSAQLELLTDCWDLDPDARLTAQCVVDRLDSLQALFPLPPHM